MFIKPRAYPNWTIKLEYERDAAGTVIGIRPPEGFWANRIARAGSYSRSSFWKGMQFGAEGSMLGLPFIALEAGMAQRGEMLGSLASGSASLVAFPAMTGLISAGLSMAFPALKGTALLASVLGLYPDALVRDGILRGIRLMTDGARSAHQLEMGGSYQDTDLASYQRLSALTQMSGAVGASRRYLGQEAALFHR